MLELRQTQNELAEIICSNVIKFFIAREGTIATTAAAGDAPEPPCSTTPSTSVQLALEVEREKVCDTVAKPPKASGDSSVIASNLADSDYDPEPDDWGRQAPEHSVAVTSPHW